MQTMAFRLVFVLFLCSTTHPAAAQQARQQFPVAFETSARKALAHYPELRDAHLVFIVRPQKLPYSSRPRLGSLLLPFGPKKHRVFISSRSTPLREPTLLAHLSPTEQVGALGHELAHAAWYERTPKWKILLTGLRYYFPKHRERFEKMTDRMAVEHGLGAELLAWNRAVWPTKQRDGRRARYYYAPDELAKIVEAAAAGR